MPRAAAVSVPVRAEAEENTFAAVGREIAAALESALRNIAVAISVSVDDAAARGALGALEKPLDASVSASADTAAARGELGALEQVIEVPVDANADTAQATGELSALATPIEVPVTPVVDGAAASQARDDLGKFVSGAGTAAGTESGGAAAAAFATGFGKKVPALLVGAGAGKILTDSITQAADFKSVLAETGAVASLSAGDLAKLEANAVAMGESAKFASVTATSAAQAQQELIKGGVSVQDVLGGALEQTLLLSEATGMGAADAAGLVAVAMANFKLSGKDASLIVDQFVSSANAGLGSVEDLGESLKYSAQSFALLQKPALGSKGALEEFTVAVGLLGKQGLIGSQAGTGLSQALSQIVNPSQKAADSIRALDRAFVFKKDPAAFAEDFKKLQASVDGVKLGDVQSSVRGLDAEFASKNPELFRTRMEALKAVILESGEFKNKGAADAFRTLNGLSADFAKTNGPAFNDALNAAADSLELRSAKRGATQISTLNTALEQGVAGVSEFGRNLVDADGNIRPITEQAKRLGVALGGLTSEAKGQQLDIIFGAQGGRAFGALLNSTEEDMRSVREEVQRTGVANEIAEQKNSGLRGSLNAMGSSFDTLKLNIGLLLDGPAKGFVDWARDVIAGVNEFITGLRSGGDGVGGFGEKLSGILEPLSTIPGLIKGAFNEENIGAAKELLSTLGETLSDLAKEYIPYVIEAVTLLSHLWAEFGDDILRNAAASIKQIGAVLGGLIKIVTGVIEVIDGVLTGDWDKAWRGAKDIVSGVVKIIVGIFEGFSDTTIKLFRAIADWIKDKIQEAMDAASDTVRRKVDEIVRWFGGLVSDAAAAMGRFAGAIADGIAAVLRHFARMVSEGATQIASFASSIVTGAVNAMSRFVSAIADGIGDALGQLGQLAGRAVSAVGNLAGTLAGKGAELMQGLASAIGEGFGAVSSALGQTGSKALAAVGNLATTLKTKGQELIQGLRDGINDRIDDVEALVRTIGPKAVAALGNLRDDLVQKGKDLLQGLLDGINAILPSINSVFSGILNTIENILSKIPIIGSKLSGAASAPAPSTSQVQFGASVSPSALNAPAQFNDTGTGGPSITVNNYSAPVYDDERELVRVLGNLSFGFAA
jgi:hypothetical protein